MLNYNHLISDMTDTKITIWDQQAIRTIMKSERLGPGLRTPSKSRYCLFSVVIAFAIGLTLGVLIPIYYHTTRASSVTSPDSGIASELPNIRGVFVNNSFSTVNSSSKFSDKVTKQSVSFVSHRRAEDGSRMVDGDIYWSDYVESLLPKGFTTKQADQWNRYVGKGVAVKLELGCGRMQNRLATFADGRQACVRYRQNTDQIQGELFSFYLAQILSLPNLVPSAVSVVDLAAPLWSRLANDIAAAQWSSQRPVVLTQYVPNLDVGNIPTLLRPADRHLNKLDVLTEVARQPKHLTDATSKQKIVELAQWSDLIVFDYLTANLDRVVNNLYNYQWNSNIMEAPAHNLAKEVDTELLVFLDNESGLLHGYRLLEKYEAYHGLLLENLCLFRKRTAQMIERLRREGNVGVLLKEMFERRNADRIKDVLPTIPDKSIKILNARIQRVHEQILKCQTLFKQNT